MTPLVCVGGGADASSEVKQRNSGSGGEGRYNGDGGEAAVGMYYLRKEQINK